MSDDATENAVNRIELAMARIDGALQRHRRARAVLAERHGRLRDRVGNALAEIDSLIAQGGE